MGPPEIITSEVRALLVEDLGLSTALALWRSVRSNPQRCSQPFLKGRRLEIERALQGTEIGNEVLG